ncbi:MAG TPA: hypothetical protein VLG50_05085 [Candidatus Saccharimonadales bacterium]|nr:hypothetical protein [Candidatus Saccharimonadales bacterium]
MELLEGQWHYKNTNIQFLCHKNNQYLYQHEQICGQYYKVDDGYLITFYLFDNNNNTLTNYTGKLYFNDVKHIYVEKFTTRSHTQPYYKQNLWTLHDLSDHENITLSKI